MRRAVTSACCCETFKRPGVEQSETNDELMQGLLLLVWSDDRPSPNDMSSTGVSWHSLCILTGDFNDVYSDTLDRRLEQTIRNHYNRRLETVATWLLL